jgi:hypothetical protein
LLSSFSSSVTASISSTASDCLTLDSLVMAICHVYPYRLQSQNIQMMENFNHQRLLQCNHKFTWHWLLWVTSQYDINSRQVFIWLQSINLLMFNHHNPDCGLLTAAVVLMAGEPTNTSLDASTWSKDLDSAMLAQFLWLCHRSLTCVPKVAQLSIYVEQACCTAYGRFKGLGIAWAAVAAQQGMYNIDRGPTNSPQRVVVAVLYIYQKSPHNSMAWKI